MRTILRRTAIVIGGSAAGIIIGLSISGTANADDRPPLLGGITDTIETVVEDVLPPPPRPAPKPENGNDEPNPPPPPPSRPVKDAVEEVVDEVEDVVEDVVDTLPRPPAPIGNPPPEQPNPPATPDVPATVPDTPDINPQPEPEPDGALPLPPPVQPDATLGPVAAPATVATTGQHGTCEPVIPCDSGHDGDGRQQNVAALRAAIHAVTGLRLTLGMPDYRTPTPRTPSGPGHDATGSIGVPHTPTIGLELPATVTARAGLPHTTAVRIPGRDQGADGLTQSPDAPSG